MTTTRNDDAELRLMCLAEASAAAKLGLSHDIYQTADKYYRWVTGEKVEAVPELPFKTAVIALMEAEILGERTDIEKLREDLAEAFGIVEDKHWPRRPMSPEDQAFVADASARFAKAAEVQAADDVRRARDAEFIGGFEWPGEQWGDKLPKVPVIGDLEEAASQERAVNRVPGMADLDRRLRETEDRIVQPIVDSLLGTA